MPRPLVGVSCSAACFEGQDTCAEAVPGAVCSAPSPSAHLLSALLWDRSRGSASLPLQPVASLPWGFLPSPQKAAQAMQAQQEVPGASIPGAACPVPSETGSPARVLPASPEEAAASQGPAHNPSGLAFPSPPPSSCSSWKSSQSKSQSTGFALGKPR